jgi:hypothetical protein
MALGTSLTLSKDSPTDVDTNTIVYDLRAADLNHSEYGVAGLTLPSVKEFVVSHDTGKGGELRHLMRLNHTEIDAFGVPATASVYLNIVRPSSTAITNAVIIEMVNRLIDFLIEGGSNGNVTKILNREV